MRIVVRLLDERQFFTLRLIQTSFNAVSFLQLLKSQHEQLRIVFVREGPKDKMVNARSKERIVLRTGREWVRISCSQASGQ